MRYRQVTAILAALVLSGAAACGGEPAQVAVTGATTTSTSEPAAVVDLAAGRAMSAAIERAHAEAAFARAVAYVAAVEEAERIEAERLEAERRHAAEHAAQEAAERAERERATSTQQVAAPAPQVAGGSPSSNRALGADMAAARGWSGGEWSCLDALWSHESGWRHDVWNRQGSGAYGIPQALPGSKMASHGADWQTNPATQIAWGLDYIAGRYGTPCGARAHSLRVGWY